MTKFQVGWTAGIIDGEGSISICVSRAKGNPTGYRIVVRVGNTDRKMLNRLKELWGGSICICRQNSQWGYRDFFGWTLLSLNAYNMLLHIAPHLVTKQAQAKTAMRLQRRIKGRFGHEILIDRTGWRPKFKGATVTPSEWRARHRLYLKMKLLNTRRVVRPNAKINPPALCPGNRAAA